MVHPGYRPIHRNDLDEVFQATTPLWEEMRGERIFITGGTGFFGCWLLETFCHINRSLQLHAEALVLTRDPLAFAVKAPHLASDAAVTLLRGDVRDFPFPSGSFRFIIHAATETGSRASAFAHKPQEAATPLDQFSTIVDGTRRMLEFAASHGTARFLLTSSRAVYGRQPSRCTHLSESYTGAPDPLDAGNVYGEAKRAAELLCALFSGKNSTDEDGLGCAIARCWAFTGAHLPLDGHFAIGNFIGDVLRGRPIRIYGDGSARRSYLYGSDLTIWLWTMLFRAPALMPIHVGSAEDVSILELARAVAAVMSPQTQIQLAASPLSGTPAERYVPSVDRAEKLLGLRQRVGLHEAIARTAAWYR